MHFPLERCSSPGSSTGDSPLKPVLHFPLFLLLVVGPLYGQQEQSAPLQSLFAAAQQAQNANDYAAAAADYKQAVKLRPDLPELWANLGLMQHQQGNYPDAIQSFREANRLNPSLYVPNLFLGIDYVQTGQAKEAIPLLQRAEKINGRDPLPSLTLGRAYSSLGSYRLASAAFQNTIRTDPNQSSAWFNLGIAYLRQVEADSRTMTTGAPDSPYAQALFAEALVKQSRFKEAADLYQGILAGQDQPECMRSEAGFLALRQGDTSAAAAAFQAEREEHPECTLAILGQARLQIDPGSYKEALALLQQAWARDEGFFASNASALFSGMPPATIQQFLDSMSQPHAAGEIANRLYDDLQQSAQGIQPSAPQPDSSTPAPSSFAAARREYFEGRYSLCAKHLRAGLKSSNFEALQTLAACSFFSGDYKLTSSVSAALLALGSRSTIALYWLIKANEKLALQSLTRFQQLEPNSPRTHILLGDVYRQRERYDDAQKEYATALDLSPDNPAALLGLASAYLDEAKIDQAIATAQRALDKQPGDPEINVVMGEALIEQHKFSQAESHLMKGLSAKPQMLSHIHAMLGETYAAEGKTEDAIAQMKMGLDSDQDGSLHYQLARLYSRTGDKADADIAISQMKALQQRRRKTAVIALEDSHPSSLDDEP